MRSKNILFVKDSLICAAFFLTVISIFCSVVAVAVLFWNKIEFWSILFVLVAVATMLRKRLRLKAYCCRVKNGIDFGINQKCLDAVQSFLRTHGKRGAGIVPKQPQVAKDFDLFAAKYSIVKFKGILFSQKTLNDVDLELCDKLGNIYRCIGREGNEAYYCVKLASNDERIFKLELELCEDPYPYASDIYHYFAMRIDELGYMK